MIGEKIEELIVTSDAFTDGGKIPVKYTGKGEDISPGFKLSAISERAKSVAIIMDDIDLPMMGTLTHWVVWNLPVQDFIPENIPYTEMVPSLGNAVQGVGYGKNRYRGPNPPAGTHRYRFTIYILDKRLDLLGKNGKEQLLQTMKGHILQQGSITGRFA